jgi:hypothetical protein
MADLLERLKDALADSYTIDHKPFVLPSCSSLRNR